MTRLNGVVAPSRSDSRFGVIGYSWNVNNVGSNDSHAERWETEEAQAIHKLRPSVKVMVTREVQEPIALTSTTLKRSGTDGSSCVLTRRMAAR